ncbi:hypothetical protein [Natrinema sp. 1APR25-10V2]|uniref:DUF7344 domain-containing protein n=1 Tax=Natrinema sp. 1APR25-10V2 TaxID=2951081 RepID=UPI002874644C|nr:hypothetical protein [Natrinema sp. 1APR25-10V2]MDS0474105.1 hypothetical protein [Natrinema sp. 1APR25-10V2]
MTTDCDRNDDDPAATGDSSDGGARLSWSATFAVLSHWYRREVLRFVADADDHTATVDELTAHLVERTDEPPRCDRIMIALHHVHLPTLSEADVVDYDAESKVVSYRRCGRVEAILERARSEEPGREFPT